MDTYRTEDEQVAAIKRIVADHGTKILAVIVVSIAAIFSYQGYHHNKLAEKEAASLYYNRIIEVVGDSAKLDAGQQEIFDTTFDSLLKEYPESIYASYATLAKAKMEVGSNDLAAAVVSLQWVVEQDFSQQMLELANLRLARVIFAQGDLDKALMLLDQGSETFAAEYAESKADVLVAKGDKVGAVTFYNEAKELAEKNEKTVNHILRMKLESLQPEGSSELYPVEKTGKK